MLDADWMPRFAGSTRRKDNSGRKGFPERGSNKAKTPHEKAFAGSETFGQRIESKQGRANVSTRIAKGLL